MTSILISIERGHWFLGPRYYINVLRAVKNILGEK